MNCPICNNTELSEGAESCPKCGSDLEVFTHIEGAKKENAFQKKSILVLAAVLGIVVVSWGSVSLLSGNKTEIAEISPEETTKAIAPLPDSATLAAATAGLLLKKENETLKSEIASLKSETKTAKEPAPAVKESVLKGKKKKIKKIKTSDVPVEGGIITHTVKRGESPWTISKKYFKNGSHAKQIIADNNLENVKNIPIGTQLKIQK
jgi:nucleoid-associated protein YgaU